MTVYMLPAEMAPAELVLGGEAFRLPSVALRQSCTIFAHIPPSSRYEVRSPVPADLFRTFLSALNGTAVDITKDNIDGLCALCHEFGFNFSSPLFRGSRISMLEAEVAKLCSASEAVRAVHAELQTELAGLKNAVTGLATKTESIKTNFTGLSSEVSLLKASTPDFPRSSLIVSDFPDIFAEFRGKRFSLLWRGSRDGFGARDFHRRCDGHANTLTVILDTNGNVFGGFTPVEWDSTRSRKADDSLRSFLFTLGNPHNIPAKRFALKAERKRRAIWCPSGWGPCFGASLFACDLAVSDNCNANMRSGAGVGIAYINDTGLDGKTVFTGSYHFQVKEIEVFEITE
jgi:hypothetical protein